MDLGMEISQEEKRLYFDFINFLTECYPSYARHKREAIKADSIAYEALRQSWDLNDVNRFCWIL